MSVGESDAGIVLDIRYYGAENFVGAPIDGYDSDRCLLTPPAATALVRVQRELRAQRLGLVVFDCYRPQRAVDHFVRWAEGSADTTTQATYYPNVEKTELFAQGYIARQSGHSRGSTVDVGLVKFAEDGEEATEWHALDMGTPFDFFDPRSHTDASEIADAQRANRVLLRRAMEQHGFRNYPREWWHFTLAAEPYPGRYFDVVVE